jgi:hypothetical protein
VVPHQIGGPAPESTRNPARGGSFGIRAAWPGSLPAEHGARRKHLDGDGGGAGWMNFFCGAGADFGTPNFFFHRGRVAGRERERERERWKGWEEEEEDFT